MPHHETVSHKIIGSFMQSAQPHAVLTTSTHPVGQGRTAAFLMLALFFVTYNTSAVFFQLRGVPSGHLASSLLGYLAGILFSALLFDRMGRKSVWQASGRTGFAARSALLAVLLLPGLFCLASFAAIPYSGTFLLNAFQPFLWGLGLPVAHRLFFDHIEREKQALLFGLAVGLGHLCWSLLMLPAGVLAAPGMGAITQSHILPFLNVARALTNSAFALLAWKLVSGRRNNAAEAAKLPERGAALFSSQHLSPARTRLPDLARVLAPFVLCFLLNGVLGYLFYSRLTGRGPHAEYMHLGLAFLLPLLGLAISRKGAGLLRRLFLAAILVFGLAPLAAFQPSALPEKTIFLACAVAHQVMLSLGTLALARYAPHSRHPALVLSLVWLVSVVAIPGSLAASKLLPLLGVSPLTVASALAALCIMSLWPLFRVLPSGDFQPSFTDRGAGDKEHGGRGEKTPSGPAFCAHSMPGPPLAETGPGARGASAAAVPLRMPILCIFAAQVAFYVGASTYLLKPHSQSGMPLAFGLLACGAIIGALFFPWLNGGRLLRFGPGPGVGNRARLIAAGALFLPGFIVCLLRLQGDWLLYEPLRHTANFFLGVQVAAAYGMFFSHMPKGRRGLWFGLSITAGMLALRLMLLLGTHGLGGAASIDAAPVSAERFLPVFYCQLLLYATLAAVLLWGFSRVSPASETKERPAAQAGTDIFDDGSGRVKDGRIRIFRLLLALLVLFLLNSVMDASLFPVMPGRAGGSMALHCFIALLCPLAGYLLDRDLTLWQGRIFGGAALVFLLSPVLLGAGPSPDLVRILHGLASLALFVTVTAMSVVLSHMARGPLLCLIVVAPFAFRALPMLGALAIHYLGKPPPYLAVWIATLAAFFFYLLVRGNAAGREIALSREEARLEALRMEAENKRRAFAASFDLSAREEEILECVLMEMGNAAMAERLGISERTVRHHLGGVLAKTGQTNRKRLLHHYTSWRVDTM